MDSNENKRINLELENNLDDVETIDLALELSNYEDEELQELCDNKEDEELARYIRRVWAKDTN